MHNIRSVSCGARVAWVNQEENPFKPKFSSGVGVQFIDLAPEGLASIASCLDIEAILVVLLHLEKHITTFVASH